MISKKQRLTVEEIDFIMKNKHTVLSGVLFAVHIYKKENNQYSRFAILLPRKSVKKSVDRHTIKRMVYQSIQDSFQNLLSLKNISIIFLAQKSKKIETPLNKTLLFELIKKDLQTLYEKISS